MKENISASRTANAIRMMRGTSFSGAFLIVEGETDPRVYRRFIDENSCQIFSSHGKENAIRVLKILESDNFVGVLAIVDADFWRLEGIELNSPNLFITDTHDLETMILKSPALEKLLTEFGSAVKIEKLIRQLGKKVENILLDSGIQIGYFRWVSHRERLSLKFEGIVFSNFIDDQTLEIDVSKMIIAVKNKSQRHDLQERDLLESISNLADPNHDRWDVCCGHDLVCILSCGFRKALGSRTINTERLEESLRLAYEAADFFDTQLHESLRAWEKANTSFRIFPNTTA